MLKSKVRIGELLLARGLISQQQLMQAVEKQKQSGSKLGVALVELGFVEEVTLLQALAAQLEVPFVDLREFSCQPELVQLLPEMFARRFRAVVLERTQTHCLVGMIDPQDIFAIDEISKSLGVEPRLALVQESELLAVFSRSYDRTEEINRFAYELSGSLTTEQTTIEFTEREGEEATPVAKLLQSLFAEAMRLHASDIHIEPTQANLLIRLRVDGLLQEQVVKEKGVVKALTQRLKLMAGLDIAEKRLPQDGRFNIQVQGQEVDVRLATMPVQYGESVVMRLLRQHAEHTSLNDLHMPPAVLQGVRALMRRTHGMFLVTGPTGSGKTTTLYGVLQELNCAETKIITVEDPIEYRLPRVCQVQVQPKIGLDFARVLRSMLRHDPDVIMVGELRDKESVEIALRASMTGHLVLATLHTNDALSSAMRLLDMGVESYLVAVALRGVLAQRLLRKLCLRCRAEHEPTVEEQQWLLQMLGDSWRTLQFSQGKGCSQCNYTGYLGRQGIFELLVLNELMLEALRHNDTSAFNRAVAQDKTIVSLANSALNLAAQGITSLQEVIRVAADLDELGSRVTKEH